MNTLNDEHERLLTNVISPLLESISNSHAQSIENLATFIRFYKIERSEKLHQLSEINENVR